MSMTEIVKVFGERKIRSVWDDTAEEWYFSVVDVVAVLTESADPRNYWKVLKNRLKKEGNQTVTNCNQLKLRAEDGKMRLTDVATAEQMFRLIQSIPSPKAERSISIFGPSADTRKCGKPRRVATEGLASRLGLRPIHESPLHRRVAFATEMTCFKFRLEVRRHWT